MTVRQDQGEAGVIEADLLRPNAWFGGSRPEIGDHLVIDLEELGLAGETEVVAVSDCPKIIPGSGRVVLSVFRHSKGLVGTLHLQGIDETIQMTAGHPVWSVSRQAWIPANQLFARESVSLWRSAAIVKQFDNHKSTNTVFTFEVHGDHCYRVGEHGLLTHNISSADCVRDPSRASNPCNIPATAFCQAHHVIPCETWDEPIATKIHECCFDLNGSDNLIMLPCCEYTGRTAAYHRGRTPSSYVNNVRQLLQSLNTETDASRICTRASAILATLINGLCTNRNGLSNDANISTCNNMPSGNCSVRCQ